MFLFLKAALQCAFNRVGIRRASAPCTPMASHNHWEYFDPSGPLSKEKRQAPRVSLCNMFSVVLLLDKPFNIIGTIITKPFAIYAPFPIPNETVVISPFVMNFAGIVFSRKLSSTHGSTRSAFVVRSVAATQDDSFAEQ
ncbi:hypothetical protein PC115_g17385 [Phytophthora cactorum]|uniref:Uncharacterized protein n=2 Tax=Phytophthora cactorum TaxID=29920 RepID=A0A8T1B9D7_9STRA|nr:hypothetical protein PC115_g17385 [Phytophthora cactorum]